ncbi:pyridoxine 5'-phosphate synthase [Coprobacter tertius]|uniref:Pyridoxine 5'-phosphate synthase n=1 Tax=Coprobacter tertius TaxID=2944915 RepID=A0ABT1MIX5_9BACT|nr:pyridoxine 5'-phosphate synthase [Coprobacter tertius]MCP9612574.1 pyridoxine 5'-phosphate synthase [Coprobacter tertius]
MTKLSVNVNKVATLRNARGGNTPDVVKVATDCEIFGADGITVHPRPDERHIRYSDVFDLRSILKTEFNIEGYPSEAFIDLVLKVKPEQVTLVPDAPDAITSNAGWDTISNFEFLSEIIDRFNQAGIRTSLFIGTEPEYIEKAAKTGTDRIELYTEPYAAFYETDPENAVAPFVSAAELARKLGLGINAGHDLNLKNLQFFHTRIPFLDEVSIGHALISDALYLGLQDTIRQYKECLK